MKNTFQLQIIKEVQEIQCQYGAEKMFTAGTLNCVEHKIYG